MNPTGQKLREIDRVIKQRQDYRKALGESQEPGSWGVIKTEYHHQQPIDKDPLESNSDAEIIDKVGMGTTRMGYGVGLRLICLV